MEVPKGQNKTVCVCIYAKEMRYQKDTCVSFFLNSTINKGKDVKINIAVYQHINEFKKNKTKHNIHTQEYLATKKNKSCHLLQKLEGSMLNKISHTQKASTTCSLICES